LSKKNERIVEGRIVERHTCFKKYYPKKLQSGFFGKDGLEQKKMIEVELYNM
jgi:hypothetical protein